MRSEQLDESFRMDMDRKRVVPAGPDELIGFPLPLIIHDIMIPFGKMQLPRQMPLPLDNISFQHKIHFYRRELVEMPESLQMRHPVRQLHSAIRERNTSHLEHPQMTTHVRQDDGKNIWIFAVR